MAINRHTSDSDWIFKKDSCFGSFVLFFFVFVMLSRLFFVALWSPEGKGLTSWLLFAMFNVILLFSHLVSWNRCCT